MLPLYTPIWQQSQLLLPSPFAALQPLDWQAMYESIDSGLLNSKILESEEQIKQLESTLKRKSSDSLLEEVEAYIPPTKKRNHGSETIVTKNFVVDLSGVPDSLKELPKFLLDELLGWTGTGEFNKKEILVLLLVANEVFLLDSVYSKIKAVMKSNRTRASIRRKIEKLVAKEAGFFGGLLRFDRRVKTKEILRKKCIAMLEEETEDAFFKKCKSFVQENSLLSA